MTDSKDPLRELDRDVTPPDILKGQVTDTLRSRGYLRPSRSRLWRNVMALAAALFVFVLGRETGKASAPPTTHDSRLTYVLLLYEDSTFDRSNPEASYVAEYTAWADTLRQRNQMVDGMPLEPTSVILTAGGSADRAIESDAGVMSGFFIIKAASQEEAVAIARTCPHLRHGGRVAVRPVPSGV